MNKTETRRPLLHQPPIHAPAPSPSPPAHALTHAACSCSHRALQRSNGRLIDGWPTGSTGVLSRCSASNQHGFTTTAEAEQTRAGPGLGTSGPVGIVARALIDASTHLHPPSPSSVLVLSSSSSSSSSSPPPGHSHSTPRIHRLPQRHRPSRPVAALCRPCPPARAEAQNTLCLHRVLAARPIL
ncbi:hypothetical protein ACJBU6_00134 [Exserohilum turcicum]